MFERWARNFRVHWVMAAWAGVMAGLVVGACGSFILFTRYRPVFASEGWSGLEVIAQRTAVHGILLAVELVLASVALSAIIGQRLKGSELLLFYVVLGIVLAATFPVAALILLELKGAVTWQRLLFVNALLGLVGLPLGLLFFWAGRRFVPQLGRPSVSILVVLLLLLIGVASGLPGDRSRAPMSPPSATSLAAEQPSNVLLLVADTLRSDHLGIYGYPRDTTPVLDALAADGLVFSQTISQAPNTHPSVASILTSQPVSSFGLDRSAATNADRLADYIASERDTLAEILARHGYDTAAVVTNAWLKSKGGFAQGFEYFDDQTCIVEPAGCVTREALAWLDRPRGEAPFFLWLHYVDPHHPYDPPPPYDTLFTDPERQVRPFVDNLRQLSIVEQTKFLKAVGIGRVSLSDAELAHIEGLYDGEIRYLDSEIGVLLDALEERDLTENTLVIFVADHGEEFLDHGRMLHSHTLYDDLLHVPLILRHPRLPRGQRIDRQVSTLDIVPTVLDIVGVAARDTFAGRSLFAEGVSPPVDSRLGTYLSSYRTADWKFITSTRFPTPTVRRPIDLVFDWGRVFSTFEEELFDLRRDPEELHSLLKRRIAFQLPEVEIQTEALDEETQEQLRSLGYLN